MNMMSNPNLKVSPEFAELQQLKCKTYWADDAQAEDYVLIHGWGMGADIWQPILPMLGKVNAHCISLPGFDASSTDINGPDIDEPEVFELSELLSALENTLPKRCHLIAYSLGGLLAQCLLSSEKVVSLSCLGVGPCFVAKEQWPAAMNPDDFEIFLRSFEDNPEACLSRFVALQNKDDSQSPAENRKSIIEGRQRLKASGFSNDFFSAPRSKKQWLNYLKLLETIDARAALQAERDKNIHFILAENDALVPVTVAKAIEDLQQDNIQISLLKGSHNIPASIARESRAELLLQASLKENPAAYRLDKMRIAKSFSKSAKSYDSVAALQRNICQRLFSQVPAEHFVGKAVLDLGSGTAYFQKLLEQCFSTLKPKAESRTNVQQHSPTRLLNLDLAEGMLQFSKQQAGQREEEISLLNVDYIAADAESLPLANESIDCLFSSLAIQWCQQEDQLFKELYRVLKPGATAYIATLGPRSLWQLREAWRQVDDKVHVNRFRAIKNLCASIEKSGLSFSFEEADIDLAFDSFTQLRYELKTLGAQNMNAGQNEGLSSRERLTKLLAAYEDYRYDSEHGAKLPLTYQVFYLKLMKPLA